MRYTTVVWCFRQVPERQRIRNGCFSGWEEPLVKDFARFRIASRTVFETSAFDGSHRTSYRVLWFSAGFAR